MTNVSNKLPTRYFAVVWIDESGDGPAADIAPIKCPPWESQYPLIDDWCQRAYHARTGKFGQDDVEYSIVDWIEVESPLPGTVYDPPALPSGEPCGIDQAKREREGAYVAA